MPFGAVGLTLLPTGVLFLGRNVLASLQKQQDVLISNIERLTGGDNWKVTCSIIQSTTTGDQGARGSTLALAGLPAQPEQACHRSWGSWAQQSQHELAVPSQPSLVLRVRPSDNN